MSKEKIRCIIDWGVHKLANPTSTYRKKLDEVSTLDKGVQILLPSVIPDELLRRVACLPGT